MYNCRENMCNWFVVVVLAVVVVVVVVFVFIVCLFSDSVTK